MVCFQKNHGKKTVDLDVELPISDALAMLNALEMYALDCYNVTQSHIAAVKALDTIEEIESYDYTVGYPKKLSFPG